MPYYVRIGSSLVLAAATSLLGCGGNPGASTVVVTKEEAGAQAGPAATKPAAKGKASPKFIPRSESKR
jgi:hypothetical protein